MKIYTEKLQSSSQKTIVCDDMILTKDLPTTAGSKMLEGYVSLFEAEVLSRLFKAGYTLGGKANVGEFAIDLVGESSYFNSGEIDEKLIFAPAEILNSGEAIAVIGLDVNGSIRRGSAQNGLVSIKPTYGVVSRYGTIPVACSGECVSVISKTVDSLREVFFEIVGHDDKDGTSLSEEICQSVKENSKSVKRVAVIKSMMNGADESVLQAIERAKKSFIDNGIEVVEIENEVISLSRPAWNVLMSAELCNNVSRYDGVKFGYRAQNFIGIDELYTNSRTEAFGELLKSAILFGSDTLSTESYFKVYDKCLRSRRLIVESFSKIFGEFDGVLMPACSKMEYTKKDIEENKSLSFEENYYTAPASITGLPAVVCGGVQLVGSAFSENKLLSLCEILEKGVN